MSTELEKNIEQAERLITMFRDGDGTWPTDVQAEAYNTFSQMGPSLALDLIRRVRELEAELGAIRSVPGTGTCACCALTVETSGAHGAGKRRT